MIKKLFFQISMSFAAMLVAEASPANPEAMAREIGHELLILPSYNVFDNLAYRIDADKVTLLGQVTVASLKTDAESAVKRVEGVASVDNRIEVLPLSSEDERIRMAVYRAIYLRGPLQHLRLNAVLPIHIIVKEGGITLEGVVARQADKHLAGVATNGVSGALTLRNNLEVERVPPNSSPDK